MIMKKIILPFFLFIFNILTFTNTYSQDAATFITTDQNTWQDAVWTEVVSSKCPTPPCDLDGIPDADDDVTLQPGSEIEIDQNEACFDLTIEDDGTYTALSINAGVTLTVNDDFNVDDTGDDSFIDIQIDGKLLVEDAFQPRTSATNSGAIWTINIGTLGVLDINDGTANGTKFWMTQSGSEGTINCEGIIDTETDFYTLTRNGGIITIDISNDAIISCEDWYQYVRSAGSSITTNINGGTLEVASEIEFGLSGATQTDNIIDMNKNNNPQVYCGGINSGDWAFGSIVNTVLNPSNFTFNIAGSPDLPNNANILFNKVTVESGVTLQLGANFPTGQLLGDLDVKFGGTFTNTLNLYTLDVTGDITNAGTLTLSGATTANNLANTSLLTQSATITLAGNYSNSLTHNASANMDIVGNFTNTGTYTSTGSNINLEGNWNNSGTYTYNAGDIVSFDGSSNSTITGATDWYVLNANNSGGVTVSSGNQNIYFALDIDQGAFDANSNTVTLISDASGTAVLSDIGTGSYSGNLTVQRFVNEGNGWYLLASPLTGADLEDWNGESDMTGFTGTELPSYSFKSVQYYDETVLDVKDSGYVVPGNTSDIIVNGRGYWMYIADDSKGLMPKTLDATSSPATGQKVISLTFSSSGTAAEDGWHCIGNPYASTVKWDAVTKSSVIGNTCYALNTAGGYTTYSGSSNDSIASGEAVWVQVSAAGSVTFDENDKCGGADPYNAKVQQVSEYGPQLKLLLTTNNYTDVAHIRFHDNATTGFEPDHDAYKLNDLYGTLTNISMLADTTNVAVNTLPSNVSLATIPIRTFKVYPMSAIDTCLLEILGGSELANNNKCVFFEDVLTGDYFKIVSDTTYTFTLADTTDVPRFFIHVSTPLSITSYDETCYGINDGSIIALGNGTGPFDYVWENENGDIIQESYSQIGSDTLTNIGAGSYTVTVSNNSLCGDVSRVIDISSLEEITLSILATNLLCNGDVNGDATVTTNGGLAPFTYLWDSNAGSQITTAATGLAAGTYSVSVTDANSCIESQQITLYEPNLMVSSFVASSDTTYLSNGGVVNFNNTSTGASSYYWEFGDGGSSTDISPWNMYSTSGNYSVMLVAFDGNNCYDTSYYEVSILDEPVSVNDLAQLNSNIKVSQDEYGAIIDFEFLIETPVMISLYTTLGQKAVHSKTLVVSSDRVRIDLENESSGIYFIKISTPTGMVTKKMYF